jgi:acyl-CoA synthetase (AMP-forming)/AMP-acid ligase II/acyl carrier protein
MAHVHPVAPVLNAPQHLCIHHLLEDHAKRTPDAPAIIAPGHAPLTYGRLRVHVDDVVQTLHTMGLGRHDRVALVLPNGPEMAVAFLGVAAGATCTPLNPAYSANEFDFYLADLNAKALIIQADTDSPVRASAHARGISVIKLSPTRGAEAGLFTLTSKQQTHAARDAFAQPDDVALVLHTAGTTSRPKIVPLTHTNICTSAYNRRVTVELTKNDRCLNVLPLFHVHGLLGGVLASLIAGASIVCTPGFDASKFFAWMAEFRPTWYTAVPAIHQAILVRAAMNHEIIAHCPLRFIRSGSAALPPQVLVGLERAFNVPVIMSYGMTEAPLITADPLPPRERKADSVGVAAGPEVAIIDEMGALLPAGEIGEIVVRGSNVFQGYDNNPTANQSAFTDGWFRTGDQGYLDSDGYLFITGRLKEIISRGGEKIAPWEVDDVLMDHPAVAEAVTFAVPDPRLGEEIAAAIVLQHNALVTASDIRQFAVTRLPAFKVPRQVLIVQDIPKGPTGKLQRIGLAEKLGVTAPDLARAAMQEGFTAPRTPVEEVLAALWAQVLNVERVGIYDNFFQLGGDSLLATQLLIRVREVMQVEVPFISFFDTPTVAEMVKSIETDSRVSPALPALPLQPAPRNGALPLSYAQQRLWFLNQLGLSHDAYNLLEAMRLLGMLDVAALAQSLREIVRRHEVLRTTFTTIEGQPRQVIRPTTHLPFPIADLQEVPACEREAQLHTLVREEGQRPFDLAEGPLLRATLLRLSPEEHVLLLTMHHIVSDGWSHGVFWRELAMLYEAFATGKSSPLPDLSIQYADFAHWQLQWLQGEVLEARLAYWKPQLASLSTLQLPTDHPRPAVQTSGGTWYPLRLSPALTQELKALSQQHGVTLFMTLLAAFQSMLHRYTGQDDIVVGSLIANRNRVEIEGLIGFFVNTLVLRTDLSGNPSFQALLGRVREVTLGAYSHQDLPFEKLLEELRPQRDLSHNPLFQVMFVLHNTPRQAPQLPGLTVRFLEIDMQKA